MKKVLMILFVLLLIAGTFLYYKREELFPKKEEKEVKEEEQIPNYLFQEYYKQAKTLANQMTLEEKIAQLFLVRYDKNEVEKNKDLSPGGYILFAKDFESNTKESMKKELEEVQSKNKYPLLLAVDEEGGYVTRVSRFPAYRKEKFSSPKYYYETGGYSLLEQTEKEKAQLLKSLGINLNLAPVVDISTDEKDFIYNRSFGKNAEETAEFAKNMVTYANNNGISSCLKHFPGYGNNQDTHTGIAIDDRAYETFLQEDFLPFQAGIKAQVPCILVSHNIVKSIDEKYPSSLSAKVIQELRKTLGFTGIVMTDDLAMDAVKNYVENKEAATMAFLAGNDMIITSDFSSMYQEMVHSVKEGKIKEEDITNAVIRILSWKYKNKLF
ncbi:MAG: beta-hexosaminidase [Bacilli bacterium]|nr:beta-hexosaminidase [Bacilli bacterium]